MSGLSKLKGLWKQRIAVLIAAVLIFEGTILPVSAATLSSATSSEQEQMIESIEGDSSILDDEQSMNSLSGNVISGNSDKEVSDNAGESALSMNDNKASTLELDGASPDPDFTLSIAKGSEHANLYVDEYGDYRLDVEVGKSVELSVNSVDQSYSDLDVTVYQHWLVDDYISVSANSSSGIINVDINKNYNLWASFDVKLGNKVITVNIEGLPLADEFKFLDDEMTYYIDESGNVDSKKSSLITIPFYFGHADEGHRSVFFIGQIVSISSNNPEVVDIVDQRGADYYGYDVVPKSGGEAILTAVYENPITKERIQDTTKVVVYKEMAFPYDNPQINHYVRGDEILGQLQLASVISDNHYKWKYPLTKMTKFPLSSSALLPVEKDSDAPYTLYKDGKVKLNLVKITKPIITMEEYPHDYDVPTQPKLILNGPQKNKLGIYAHSFYNGMVNTDNYVFKYDYKELSNLGLVFFSLKNPLSIQELRLPHSGTTVFGANKSGKAKVEVTQSVYRKKIATDSVSINSDSEFDVDFDDYTLVSSIPSIVTFDVINDYKGLSDIEFTYKAYNSEVAKKTDSTFLEKLEPGDSFELSCNTLGVENDAIVVKSSDSSVLKVNQYDKNHTIVEVLKDGKANLVISSKQSSKFKKTYSILVRDYCPVIIDKKIALNAAQSIGSEVTIRPAYNAEFTNVNVQAVAYKGKSISENTFQMKLGQDGKYRISPFDAEKAKSLKTGTYTLTLCADFKGKVQQSIGTVLVVVSRKIPSVTIKQTQDINSFYCKYENAKLLYDSNVFNGKLKINVSNVAVSNVSVKDQETEDFQIEYVQEEAYYNVYPYHNKEDFSSMDKTITVLTSLEGYYEPIERTIKLKSRNTPYKLVLDDELPERVVFTKVDDNLMWLRVYNTTLGCYYEGFGENELNIKVIDGENQFTVEDNRSFHTDKLSVLIKNSIEKSGKCTFTMQPSSWSDAVKISYEYKVNSNLPIAKANKSSIVLNNYRMNNRTYSSVETILIQTDHMKTSFGEYLPNFEVQDDKGTKSNVFTTSVTEIDAYGSNPQYQVSIYAKRYVKEGTYTVYLAPIIGFQKQQSNVELNRIKLVIKVVNKETKDKLTMKGQLDVARFWDEYQLELVPELTNIAKNSKEFIINEEVFGEDGYLFKVVQNPEDNKYYLALKDPECKLNPNRAYYVDLEINYTGAYNTPSERKMIKNVKIKLVEKKVKLKMSKSSYVVSRRQGNNAIIPTELFCNDFIENAFSYGCKIEQLNYTKEFTCNSYESIGYDEFGELKRFDFNIRTKSNTALIVGKTYPLKFKITPNAGALEGTSYTVTVNVKVVE